MQFVVPLVGGGGGAKVDGPLAGGGGGNKFRPIGGGGGGFRLGARFEGPPGGGGGGFRQVHTLRG